MSNFVRLARVVFLSLVLLPTGFGSFAVLAVEPVSVRIEGLEGKTLENTEKMLRTPPGIVQPDGTVNLPLLKRFEQDAPKRVRQAVEPFGYYESRVETNLRKSAEGAYDLVVQVVPGEPVRVVSVRVKVEGPGEREGALERLISRFPLEEGAILRQDRYEKAKEGIKSRAIDLGYLDADFTTHLITVDVAQKKAEIDLVLVTGERYFFNGVTFSGSASYPDRFLKRYLAFKPGDPFAYPKLAETQVNLRNSDRFRDVVVTADKEVARSHQVPVLVNLTDAPSKRMRLGAGYETDSGPRCFIFYQDLNVLDRGHQFDAELNIAGLTQGAVARYVVPSSRNLLSYTALKFTLEREDVPAYSTYLGMFEIDREKNLGGGRMGGVFLRFFYEDSDVGGQRNKSYLTLPGIKFAVQHYNNPLRPTRGYRFSGELRGTGRLLGSDQAFVQFLSEGAVVRRISRNLIFHGRGQIGLTVQRESIRELPATLRFFAGGDRSVRGYGYQALGPKNSEGDVVGGRNVLVGSMELERTVGQDWGIAIFYDAGNAFNDFNGFKLFQGAGLGVRYYTMVGPIKLDIARPLDKLSPVVRIHLSFGIGI